MICTINTKDIDDTSRKLYYDKLVGKIYKILPLYEESKEKDIANFLKYIDVVLAEITGYYHYTNNVNFIILSCIVNSLKDEKFLNHERVKALTFHCIDIIKKNQ